MSVGQPKKAFCINNHDTRIVGRYTGNYECKECSRLRRINSKSHIRNLAYKRTFGITLQEYNDLFVKQNGLCKGCYIHQRDLKIAFAVDHNHTTGKVRGLLCGNCNVSIGNAKDSPEILRRLADYVEKEGLI